MNQEGIIEMLEAFVDERSRSKDLAGDLEVRLDREYPDDPLVQNLVLALASYEPGGGEFLYDQEAIATLCREVLSHLCAKEAPK